MAQIKRALLSVSNKENILELAKILKSVRYRNFIYWWYSQAIKRE